MEQFAYIPYTPGKENVMRRMGAKGAQMPKDIEREINTLMDYAQTVFHVSGKALVLPVTVSRQGLIEINGEIITSEKLKGLLRSSTEAYLMCAALSASNVEKINEAMMQGEGLKALVLDAYASECVDGALGVIAAKKNAALRRVGKN